MSDQGSAASVVSHEAGLCNSNVARAFDFLGKRWNGVILGALSQGPTGFRRSATRRGIDHRLGALGPALRARPGGPDRADGDRHPAARSDLLAQPQRHPAAADPGPARGLGGRAHARLLSRRPTRPMSASMTATGWLVRGLGRLSTVPLDRQLADLASRRYPAYAPLPRGMRARYDVRETTIDGCPVLRLTPRSGASGQHLIYTHGGCVRARPGGASMVVHRPVDPGHRRHDHPAVLSAGPRGRRRARVRAVADGLRRADRHAAPVRRSPWRETPPAAGWRSARPSPTGRRAPRRRGRSSCSRPGWTSAWPTRRSRPCSPAIRCWTWRRRVAFGRLWAGGVDQRHPSLSPLYADLTGLPPVHTFQGGRDILAADAQLLAGRLRQAGNPGTFTFVPGAFHNYLARLLDPGGPGRSARRAAAAPPAVLTGLSTAPAEGKWSAGSNQGGCRR